MRKIKLFQRATLTVFILLLSFVFANAQNGKIKGTVRDERGPLAGASVTLDGRGSGTTTNSSGDYELSVRPGTYMVNITFAGFQLFSTSVTVSANETSTADATLTASGAGDEVVIVGSRTTGRSKLSTPVPVDVITAKELKSYAQMDASQVLTYVAPSFQSARQTISDGTDHIDPAGLRGLGPDQTLVLVNGKRRHNTALVNINGTVGRGSVGTDLNAIPVAAIERIEVLRDGAAAQYGSDAIAGVINIVLKKNYTGLNVSGTIGQNFTHLNYGGGQDIEDGLTHQFDWSAGTRIGHTGGHVVFSGQFLQRERTNRSGNDNIPLIYYGSAGAFPTAPQGENAVDFRRWLLDLDKQFTNERQYNKHNIVAGNSASENTGFFSNGGFPLWKKSEIYWSGGYGHRNGDASGFSRNPNSFSQQPVLASGTLYYSDGFLPQIHTKIDDRSFIGGLRTNCHNWDIDLSNTFGTNKIGYNIQNTGNASLEATDNVRTQFDAGGLKFTQNTTNLDFSRKLKSSSFTNFNLALGGEFRYEQFQIIAGEENSYKNGGRLAIIPSLPAYNGKIVSFAPTPAAAGAQVFPGFSPKDALNKNRNILAAYADAEGTMDKLLLGAAARYEKYSDFGSGVGGKVSMRYELDPKYSIRASANAGFRAPSLHQRYFQNTSTQFVGGLPSQSLTANNDNPIVRDSFGIQSLKPEKSLSFTLGFVGKITSGISLTIDGYYIGIKDRIVLSSAFNKSNPLVARYLPANGINVVQFWTNAVDTRTLGVDLVFTDKFKLGRGNATLSVAGNFNSNKVTNVNTNSAVIEKASNNPSLTDPTQNPANDFRIALFDRQQRSRIEVAQPKSKLNITANYQIKKWDITLRTVRFGETQYVHNVDPAAKSSTGTFFNDVLPAIDQTFDPRWVTDLVLTFKAWKWASIAVGANNIFDVYPERVFIDNRNDAGFVYNNPVAGANQSFGGYGAGRDASNRGRFLFNANQFGFNGRFLYTRATVDISELTHLFRPMKGASGM